ncbi:MAG TPA: peptide-N4-asparagine amidase [Candidatus Dormibacteraeota bacterium]|jgi:hypothetical protein|nr:peptide-N4-asparagine amidase [Candidatus Dormibacteraeota bacterium]
MRRTFALALACAVLLLPGNAAAVGAPATDFPQQTANPPVSVPGTPSCTETVVTHDFQNSYYAPGTGTHTPPKSCPAPWSKIVLTLTASVSGTQFDRLVDVYVGHVPVLSSSTSEPCCAPGSVVHWTVRKDVTEYASLLQQTQPVTVFLNNVWIAGQYTGIYHVTVGLDFYRTATGVAEGAHPDRVLPVTNFQDSGADGYFSLGRAGQQGATPVTFPRNLRRLTAELFAQGHGPCEEFWWGDPNMCAGTPYREVAIYLDGALAGAAPVYPVVFTGANGPGLWEPIPSPRAWDLRPSVVDLSPFVGKLVDGAPHVVSLGVFDATYASGDYWLVGANLLAWTDARSKQTSGKLISASAPPTPTETSGYDPSGNAVYSFSAHHALRWEGVVKTASGSFLSTVTEDISATTSEPGLAVQSAWDWRSSTSGGDGAGSFESRFSLTNSSPGSFQFEDAGSATRSGPTPSWSRFDEQMTTAAVGLAANGAERETYTASDSSGLCYDRTLTAAGGTIVQDQSGANCPAAPASGSRSRLI